MLYLYKIYHIPSTTWLLALADTKYNTVLELPSELFTQRRYRIRYLDRTSIQWIGIC